MNYFFTMTILLLSSSIQAGVTIRWLGVSGFILSDGETNLVFDPAITRIPFYDFLPFRTVESDHQEVDYWFNQCGIKKVDGTFVNHAHTDHVIDAPYVVNQYGGKLYGSSSVINIGKGHGLKTHQLEVIKAKQDWQIGQFTITPYSTPHAPHFLNIMLMDGHIEKPLTPPASAWDYLVGETHIFFITHPKGKILFQAIGRVEENDALKDLKVDVLLLTIANRISSEDLITKRIIPTGTKKLIPLHYDNFFLKMRRDSVPDELWGVDVKDFKDKHKLLSPKVQIRWPKYCEPVNLFE